MLGLNLINSDVRALRGNVYVLCQVLYPITETCLSQKLIQNLTHSLVSVI